jgi:hypothetical protein
MNDFRPLGRSSPNPLTRELLASGRADRPSDGARRNAAIAIGIAATAATTATAGGAAAGTATGTVAASKWLGGFGLLKLVGATVVSSAVVVGVAHEQGYFVSAPPPATSVNASRAPAHSKAPRPSRPLPVTPQITPPEATAPQLTTAEPTPPEHEARVESPPSPRLSANIPSPSLSPPAVGHRPSPPVRSRDDMSLRDEVLRLDRARASLAEGRPRTGLVELDAYDRAFRNGALRDEAELLRIETLAKMGDVESARVRAERLLARDEQGPLARRVRALLASLSSGAGGH